MERTEKNEDTPVEDEDFGKVWIQQGYLFLKYQGLKIGIDRRSHTSMC